VKDSATIVRDTSEVLVAEFENFASQTASIADTAEEINECVVEFKKLVDDTLAELEQLTREAITAASLDIDKATTAFDDASGMLANLSSSAVKEIGDHSDQAVDAIVQGLDSARELMDEVGVMSQHSATAVSEAIASIFDSLHALLESTRAKWAEADAHAREFLQSTEATAHSLIEDFRQQTTEGGQVFDEFAASIESELIPAVEREFHELRDGLRDMAYQVMESDVDELGHMVDSVIRENIKALFEEAVATLIDLIQEKIREIIERRDRTEPERRALDEVFAMLENLLGPLEDHVGSVKDITNAVGYSV
jgi:hypothetical protein